jgi:2Fe-2S ferredoxin
MDYVMLGNSGLAESRLAFGGRKSKRVGGIVPNVPKPHNWRARWPTIGIIWGNAGMPRLHVILRSGERRSLDAAPGQSLKDGLMAGGIGEINALTSCGGCCSCGTCEVYFDRVDFARLPAMKPSEDEVLSINEERRANSRLSCQVKLSDDLEGLTVTVAPEL